MRAASDGPAARYPMMTYAALRLAPLPVPLDEEPAIALMHPMVGYPALVRMRVLPVASNPHMPTAFPAQRSWNG